MGDPFSGKLSLIAYVMGTDNVMLQSAKARTLGRRMRKTSLMLHWKMLVKMRGERRVVLVVEHRRIRDRSGTRNSGLGAKSGLRRAATLSRQET